MEKGIRELFGELFGKKALVATAPGRVNLIGEHTDYNEGFVLPAAVDRKVNVAIARMEEPSINIMARQYGERVSIPVEAIQPMKGWPTYFLGVLHFLGLRDKLSGGLDILVDGDVPLGAGMSSSAAICSAFGLALNELFGLHRSRLELALIGQQAEHQFAGVNCGIMDQFASLHGRKGELIRLDCRSLEFEYIHFHFPDYRIFLLNTMVSHSLASSEYNQRRKECEAGVTAMQERFPGIRSLRDCSLEQLNDCRPALSDLVYKRCAYVIRENLRVLAGCRHLQAGQLQPFGRLMFEAHEGLSKGYEVSCAESDWLVDRAGKAEGIVGARQMGGGFGGCVIHIAKQEVVERYILDAQAAYEEKFGRKPAAYVVQPEDGARLVD